MPFRPSVNVLCSMMALALVLTGCSKEREDRTATATAVAPAPAVTDTSAGEVINQHIVFSGIVALIPLDKDTLRFIAMPDHARSRSHSAEDGEIHAGMKPCPDGDGRHRVWIVVPKLTSTYPAESIVCEARSKRGVEMVAIEAYGQISFPNARAGGSDRRNLGAIADSRDFAGNKGKVKDGYLKAAGPEESVAAWGDLEAGIVKASFVEKDRGWYYALPETPAMGTCRRLAQDVCHETRLANSEVIITFGKTDEEKKEVRVRPTAGKAEIRIMNAPYPFPPPMKEPVTPDTHFALYHPLFEYDDAPRVIPYLCKDRPPVSDGAAPHNHELDGLSAAEAAALPRPVGGPPAIVTPGSINCPPAWWCPDPQRCE